MSLKSIRNQINALRRKFAFPLAVIRLRRISEEYCHDWHAALTDGKPLPEAHPFIQRIAKEVLPLKTFMELQHYLDSHRKNKTTPTPLKIAETLLPNHAKGILLPSLFAGELTPRPKPRRIKRSSLYPRRSRLTPRHYRKMELYSRAIARYLRANPREGNGPHNVKIPSPGQGERIRIAGVSGA